MVTVRVISPYGDKYTGRAVQAGEILEVTEDRLQELMAKNKVEIMPSSTEKKIIEHPGGKKKHGKHPQ